jgi:predicted nucleotidyltransferase
VAASDLSRGGQSPPLQRRAHKLAGVHDWPGRGAAQRLRLWPVLERLVADVEVGPLGAAILLGSLARGGGDSLSDIDLLLVARDGQFDRAWAMRHTWSRGALYTWDRMEPGREVAKHAWLTEDLIKVECPVTTVLGGHRLAEPYAVVAGDPSAAKSLPRMGSRIEQTPSAVGQVDEIELRYGALKTALRSHL